MKYLFYAIVFDVAGNATAVGSSTSPAKTITTNIQKVTGISINPNSAQTKNIGDTFKITATVSPSDANNKGINWSSTNSGVATVDISGNVHCVSAGTTTITATAADGSGKSASLSLTVRDPLTSLTLDKSQTTLLYGGATTTVTATTDPSNYDGANISWAIADTSIATVSVSGKTATIKSTSKIGQTTLTVSAGGITKTVNVSVVNFVTTTYSYTGSVQQVELPAGTYKLEVWGASGGANDDINRGYGGYAVGTYTAVQNEIIYICVGGEGEYVGVAQNGGYNGGGATTVSSSSYGGTGGGATHIAKRTGLLKDLAVYKNDVLIVAGGGGGCHKDIHRCDMWTTWSNWVGKGGSGGGAYGQYGFEPTDSGNIYDQRYAEGGGQSSTGTHYATEGGGHNATQDGGFGYGGDAYPQSGRTYGGGRWWLVWWTW